MMTSDPDWSPCNPGTLADICTETPGNAVVWTRRSAVAAMVTATAGGGWLAVQNKTDGALSCVLVAELAPLYIAGTLQPRRIKEIDIHRRSCETCDRKLKQMEARSRQV